MPKPRAYSSPSDKPLRGFIRKRQISIPAHTTAARSGNCCHPTLVSEPSVQTMKSLSESGLAKFCIRLTNAPAIEPNIMPTMSRDTLLRTLCETAITSSRTSAAPRIAAVKVEKAVCNAVSEKPHMVSNATPRLAPEDTPRV